MALLGVHVQRLQEGLEREAVRRVASQRRGVSHVERQVHVVRGVRGYKRDARTRGVVVRLRTRLVRQTHSREPVYVRREVFPSFFFDRDGGRRRRRFARRSFFVRIRGRRRLVPPRAQHVVVKLHVELADQVVLPVLAHEPVRVLSHLVRERVYVLVAEPPVLVSIEDPQRRDVRHHHVARELIGHLELEHLAQAQAGGLAREALAAHARGLLGEHGAQVGRRTAHREVADARDDLSGSKSADVLLRRRKTIFPVDAKRLFVARRAPRGSRPVATTRHGVPGGHHRPER